MKKTNRNKSFFQRLVFLFFTIIFLIPFFILLSRLEYYLLPEEQMSITNPKRYAFCKLLRDNGFCLRHKKINNDSKKEHFKRWEKFDNERKIKIKNNNYSLAEKIFDYFWYDLSLNA